VEGGSCEGEEEGSYEGEEAMVEMLWSMISIV
jgi:hypothetical protein